MEERTALWKSFVFNKGSLKLLGALRNIIFIQFAIWTKFCLFPHAKFTLYRMPSAPARKP